MTQQNTSDFADLWALLRSEIQDDIKGSQLIDRCEELSTAIANSDIAVPEFIWHYLHDADIRGKDEIYRDEQLATTMQLLAEFCAIRKGE